MTDKELRWVQKTKNGNQQALNKLLKAHYESIYLLAYSYVKNEADALDVVQEAAYKAVNGLSRLQQEEYFSTWLNRIIINEAKRLLVRRQRENARQTSDEEAMASLVDLAETQEHDSVLMQEIHGLDEKYEEVLLLFYFNDLAIKEIASVLGTNENTVKTRLVRGRELLRLRLIAQGYERQGLK